MAILKGKYADIKITTICPDCGEIHTFFIPLEQFTMGMGYLCKRCSDNIEKQIALDEQELNIMRMVEEAARSVGPQLHSSLSTQVRYE
jgi:hypothetical protein